MSNTKKLFYNNCGVSEVVSTLLTISIIMTAVGTILLWGLPYIQERQTSLEFQNVINSYDILQNSIGNLVIDGPSSKTTAPIVNANDKGMVNVDGDADRFIVTYSFEEYFDFNVSSLDTEDRSFSVRMESGSLSKIRVHWLDPFGEISRDAQVISYGRIHKDQICVESFSTDEDRQLTEVKLYISKVGIINEPLNISIYEDLTSSSPLDYKLFDSDLIPSSFDWIEWNPDSSIPISANKSYYIVLETTGGGYGNETYNYYKWYKYNQNIYNNSKSFTGKTLASLQESELDFDYRVFFNNNNPPEEIKIERPYSLNYIQSGCNQSFTFNATDSDNDLISYKVFWGDGTNSSWTILYASELEMDDPLVHEWNKPGKYTLKILAKDEHGLVSDVNEANFSVNLDVIYGNYYSDDLVEITYGPDYYILPDPSSSGNLYNFTIPANYPVLSKTFRIDLFSDDHSHKVPFGRIWYFKLGEIEYTTLFGSSGEQSLLFQNGGVLSMGLRGYNFERNPFIYINENGISLRVVQIRGTDSNDISYSGRGDFKLKLTHKNSYCREINYPEIHYFKIKFFGDSNKRYIWFNFLESIGFEKYVDYDSDDYVKNTVYYNNSYPQYQKLVFDSSAFEVGI